MKKLLSATFSFILIFCTFFAFSGCGENKTLLDPSNPVTVSMWHVYGEQADSPMNELIEDFNATLGKEKGVIVNVTNISNANDIGRKLLDAKNDKAGALDMPDLFFCHTNNAMDLGVDDLIDWNDYFTKTELDAFVSDFINDGKIGDSLAVLPVSKSTHLLFVAGGVFDDFAKQAKVSYDDLSTWDGFFTVAEKYYDWSGGKPFCAIDYLTRCVELNALSQGATDLYTDGGWYDLKNEKVLSAFTRFSASIAKGHIVVSDLYSNTQIMTGQVVAGIGSSASILYYNDKITYPDNTQIDTNLRVLTTPQTGNGVNLATQAGIGLCAYKTTDVKAEAVTLFAKWFTEKKRNLDFVASTGYMPVLNESFNEIDNYDFQSASYKALYSTLADTKSKCTLLPEPNISGYWNKVYALYDQIRALQKNLAERRAGGETVENITDEIVGYFKALS